MSRRLLERNKPRIPRISIPAIRAIRGLSIYFLVLCLLLFLVFEVRRTCGHFLATGLGNRVGVRAMASIASLPAFDSHLIPHPDGILFPSETLKLFDASEFELPIRHLAVRILGVHKD